MPSLIELVQAFYAPKPASHFSNEQIDANTAETHRRLRALVPHLLWQFRELEVIREAAAEVGWRFPPDLVARFERQERQIGAALEAMRVRDPFQANLMWASTDIYGQKRKAAARDELTKLLKHSRPFRRNLTAWRGLYQTATQCKIDPDDLLKSAVAHAVERTVLEAENLRHEKRPDNSWVKRNGKRTLVRPAREYGIGTPEFHSWFERTVRNLVEEWLATAVADREDAKDESESLTAPTEQRPPMPEGDNPADVADANLRYARWWDGLTKKERAAFGAQGDREALRRARNKFSK